MISRPDHQGRLWKGGPVNSPIVAAVEKAGVEYRAAYELSDVGLA